MRLRWIVLMSAAVLIASAALAAPEAEEEKDETYGDFGEKEAAVQVLCLVPRAPCHKPALDMLKKLVEDYPKYLRVTIEPMMSKRARELELGCASYLMKIKDHEPPEDKKVGDYELLVQKSPEVGRWKVEDLEKRVREGLKKVDAKTKEEQEKEATPEQ